MPSIAQRISISGVAVIKMLNQQLCIERLLHWLVSLGTSRLPNSDEGRRLHHYDREQT